MQIIDFWLENIKPISIPVPKITAIYKIESPSGKVYFGQTKNLHKRYYEYKRLGCKQQRKLYNSLKRYGFDSHRFSYIEVPKNHLNKYEQALISYYKTQTRAGLNIMGGGDIREMPTSVKKRISRLAKNNDRKRNPPARLQEQHKKNIGLGVKMSLKYLLGIASRDCTKENNSFYHRKHTIESRQKMSEKRKGMLSGGKNPSAKLVLDMDTGEIFSCAKEVAEMIGVKEGTFTSWLCGQRPNKTQYIYL